MKVGLLLNHDNKLCYFSEKYEEILAKNKVRYVLIDPNSKQLLKDLASCSHILFRHTLADSDKLIYDTIYHIANDILKIDCSPNYETFWPHDNKIKEYYLLKSRDFPVIYSDVFWNAEHATAFLKQAAYPLVAKLPKGAASRNVVIVRTYNEARKIIKQVFQKGVRTGGLNARTNLTSFSNVGAVRYGKQLLKSQLQKIGLKKYNPDQWQIHKDTVLFQKFLPDNPFDTRITVIGKRAFGFRRWVRKDDFRASGSGNFDYDPDNIDKECVEIAFKVSKEMNFTTMAYDFLYDSDARPYLSEISYCFVDWVFYGSNGYWDENMGWHDSKNWPQYYQLTDFLKMDDLAPI